MTYSSIIGFRRLSRRPLSIDLSHREERLHQINEYLSQLDQFFTRARAVHSNHLTRLAPRRIRFHRRHLTRSKRLMFQILRQSQARDAKIAMGTTLTRRRWSTITRHR